MADGHAVGPQRLVVALVRGVHGLRGAVRVEVLTDRPEDRFRPGIVLHREGTEAPLTIRTAEAVKDGPGWRLTFEEVGSREAADALRQAYLETVVQSVGDLSRGEVYWHEVIGSPVRSLDGQELGVVTDIYRVAENEVYIVSGEPFGTFDVPAVRPFIRIFAPRRGEIVVDVDALGLEPPKARRTDADRPRAPRRTGPRKKRPTTTDETVAEAAPSDGMAAAFAAAATATDSPAEPAAEDATAPEPATDLPA